MRPGKKPLSHESSHPLAVALDRKEQERLAAFAGGGSGGGDDQAAEIWALVSKLACVAQAFADSQDEKALVAQLRQLQHEALETFAAPSAVA